MTKTPILDHLHDILHKDQLQNLRKLSDYLLKNAYFLQSTGRFDMGTYAENESRSKALDIEELIPSIENSCKTVGCAAGHGPLAGVKPSNKSICWEEYIEEEFTSCHRTLYTWFFEIDWETFDPTPYGAGLRIKSFLDKDPRLENFFKEFQKVDPDFDPTLEGPFSVDHSFSLYRLVEVDDVSNHFAEVHYFLRDEINEWLRRNNFKEIQIDTSKLYV